MGVLLIFIDGLGLGPVENNPLADSRLKVLSLHLENAAGGAYRNGVVTALDATMGLGGLPQSATGQTALFTGVNTAGLLGRHVSAWPNRGLRELLRRDSIFIRLKAAGKRITFANAYTPAYFLRPVNRLSASTLHMLYAAVRTRWIWEIESGQAVFQDFTNSILVDNGWPVALHTPEQAAANLAGLAQDHDFALYEFFLTDAAAHRRISATPKHVIATLDRMLAALLDRTDLGSSTVLLCSDHGNIEDMSTRSHTRNPVPLIAWGKDRERALAGRRSITDVASLVHELCAG